MSDKSYVTLATCPICGNETGNLLFDKRLRPKFDMHTMTPEPFDPCKKKYLKRGVLLLNPETGSIVVLKISAFKRIFNSPVPVQHIAFCEEEVLNRLQGKGGEK